MKVPVLQLARPAQQEPPREVKPHQLARALPQVEQLQVKVPQPKALLLAEQQVKSGQVLRLALREELVVPISQSSR